MSGPVVFTPPFKTLVDRVAAFFAAQGITATVERGWKARVSQQNQGPGRANRVVFMGSKPDGSAGSIVDPRQPGQRELGDDPDEPEFMVRALSDWVRQIQVSIWAYDGDKPNDEGAQDDAVYQLFDLVQVAVVRAAGGNAVWGAVKATVPLERSFGLELIVDLTFRHMMPDLPEDLAYASPVVVKGPVP